MRPGASPGPGTNRSGLPSQRVDGVSDGRVGQTEILCPDPERLTPGRRTLPRGHMWKANAFAPGFVLGVLFSAKLMLPRDELLERLGIVGSPLKSCQLSRIVFSPPKLVGGLRNP